jgi:hypothetical protein
MMDYGNQAHKRGLKAIIAGAGGAAHLPGMIASSRKTNNKLFKRTTQGFVIFSASISFNI